jgi:hypothetical protein
MIRERPPQSSVVAMLEAEGLPASDLTEAHFQHFFFTGSAGAPSALMGLEILHCFAPWSPVPSHELKVWAQLWSCMPSSRPPRARCASSRAFVPRAAPSCSNDCNRQVSL